MSRSSQMQDELAVEVRYSCTDLEPAEWDEVVAAADAPVFYSHAYLTAYERDPLGEIHGFAYLMVRRRGTGSAVAVAPLYYQRYPDPLGCLYAAYPEVAGSPALLSHVWHCYDGQLASVVGAAPVLPAVLDTLREVGRRFGALWCGLVNVDRAGSTAAALRAAGQPMRHLVNRFAVDLVGLTDFDSYLARLGERARANLRRNARRAADAGVAARVRPVGEVDLDEIAELCGRTAARFGNTGFYPAARFGRFVTALGPSVQVIEVRQADRLVAVGVCLTDPARFHTWTCGVDYAVDGNFSPYAVLFAESVALALTLRRPILEGGRSNAVFKERHGLRARHLDAVLVPVG
ncbi:MAG: GNAT family N-acetyltransferase [Actinobacteria bacterium]|nr:GNAT family N-acetyltransferase [Actinomycetota bacterium]